MHVPQVVCQRELKIAFSIEPSRNLATRHGRTVSLDILALMLVRHSDREISRITGVDAETISHHRQRWQVQIAVRRDKDDLTSNQDSAAETSRTR